MSTTQDEQAIKNLYGIFSSQYNYQYMIEQFFPSTDYGDENTWIDLDNSKVRLILGLDRKYPIIYNNAMPITTHSYQAYGTTSLWWLIVCCSEFTHGHEIPTGTQILVPSGSSIGTAFAQQSFTGLRGQVVTI